MGRANHWFLRGGQPGWIQCDSMSVFILTRSFEVLLSAVNLCVFCKLLLCKWYMVFVRPWGVDWHAKCFV